MSEKPTYTLSVTFTHGQAKMIRYLSDKWQVPSEIVVEQAVVSTYHKENLKEQNLKAWNELEQKEASGE